MSADETVYLCLRFFHDQTNINAVETGVCQSDLYPSIQNGAWAILRNTLHRVRVR